MTKKSAKKSDIDPASRRVNIRRDDYFFMVMKYLVEMEVGILYHVDQATINCWFYNAVKGSEFYLSTYDSSENRDDRARRATETFRKTLFDAKKEDFTPEFLGTIVSKISFLNVTNWDEFKDLVTWSMESLDERFTIYEEAFERMSIVLENGKKEEFIAKMDAKTFFNLGITNRKVAVYDLFGRFTFFVAALLEMNEIIVLVTSKTLPVISQIGKKWLPEPKLINYNVQSIYSKNPISFFLGLEGQKTERINFTSSFEIIPLNKVGEMALLKGELFYNDLVPDMVSPPEEMHLAQAVYLNVSFSAHDYKRIEAILFSLSHFMDLKKELIVYISNDTVQKRNLINIYSFKRIISVKTGKVRVEKGTVTKYINHAIYGITMKDITQPPL